MRVSLQVGVPRHPPQLHDYLRFSLLPSSSSPASSSSTPAAEPRPTPLAASSVLLVTDEERPGLAKLQSRIAAALFPPSSPHSSPGQQHPASRSQPQPPPPLPGGGAAHTTLLQPRASRGVLPDAPAALAARLLGPAAAAAAAAPQWAPLPEPLQAAAHEAQARAQAGLELDVAPVLRQAAWLSWMGHLRKHPLVRPTTALPAAAVRWPHATRVRAARSR